MIAKLQTQMFEKLMYLNLNYFNDSKIWKFNLRLINDTYYLRLAIVKSVTAVIKDILVIVFLLGNMFYQLVINTFCIFCISFSNFGQ